MRLVSLWLQVPKSYSIATYRLKFTDPLAALSSDDWNPEKVQEYSNTERSE